MRKEFLKEQRCLFFIELCDDFCLYIVVFLNIMFLSYLLPEKGTSMAEKKDVPMNTFPQVTGAEYIYAEAADGSQVKIKGSDLANVIKALIPTFGFVTYYPDFGRWRCILDMDLNGEHFLAFLYSGGSYTNAEACCFIVNIMKGANKEVTATRISGNSAIGQVFFCYKFSGNNLKIWINGTYSASGGALINLSSIHLPFKMIAENPPSDAIRI